MKSFKFEVRGMKAWGMFLFWAMTAVALHAQTFTTLHNFDQSDGALPYAGLVQGTDGNFYGTTVAGGTSGACFESCGTVFSITPGGTLTTLHSFDVTDGEEPSAALVLGTDGNFYGTTQGGQGLYGTVFQITPGGTLTTLYNFCSQPSCTDGNDPYAALVQGTDGNFYGTTLTGGANNAGTVFKITLTGTLTTLYSFCSLPSCTDGEELTGGLVQGADGNFYGTTYHGGANGDGTVFKITPGGTLTTLYSFCSLPSCTDGAIPLYEALVQGTDGNFYGTAFTGGANNAGAVFKITPTGTLTTLYSFCSLPSCTDGASPAAGLVQGTDGNFYGTSSAAAAGYGTIFGISPSGALTTLHSFDGTDGKYPNGALLQAANGTFYGTTYEGGSYTFCDVGGGCGTVFSLTLPFQPPTVTLSANPNELWPPNGKMVTVVFSGAITDSGGLGVNASTAAYSVIDSYGEDQPSNGITLGSGGAYSVSISLQASRNGNDKSGRQYTITVSAKDNDGNLGSASTVVTVPHNQ